MRVALDIKNLSKLNQPTENDVIIYDGKRWYVTTKDDLLKDANNLLLKCEEVLKTMRKEFEAFERKSSENFTNFKSETSQDISKFKSQTSQDIVELTDTVKKLFELKEGE